MSWGHDNGLLKKEGLKHLLSLAVCRTISNGINFWVNMDKIVLQILCTTYIYVLLPTLPDRHLDPFGSSVNYLDAAFRNVRNLGIVSVTSTDISSLYAKAQHVAQRHYGCNIVRTEYYKELAARMVVAAVARYAYSFCQAIVSHSSTRRKQHFLPNWIFSRRDCGKLHLSFQQSSRVVKAN